MPDTEVEPAASAAAPHGKYTLDSDLPIVAGDAAHENLVGRMRELFSLIHCEISLGVPNMAHMTSLIEEMTATNEAIQIKFAQDLATTGKTTVMSDDPVAVGEEFRRVSAKIVLAIEKKKQEMLASLATFQAVPTANTPRQKDKGQEARDAQNLAAEVDQLLSRQAIDTDNRASDDTTMSATTDKDYIDAKLEAASARMAGDMKAAAADMTGAVKLVASEMAGKIEIAEAKTDGRIASIEAKMDAKFAQFEATLHKSIFDTVKWVVGTILTLGAVGISVATFVVNNANKPKEIAQPSIATPAATSAVVPKLSPGQAVTTPEPAKR